MVKVGFGKRDITPDLAYPVTGPCGVDNILEFVLDSIWSRVLVFENRGDVVVLVAADIPNFHEKDRLDLVREIEQVCGISGFELVFHVCHMHQAPNVCWNSFSMINRDGGDAVSEENYRFFLRQTALAVQGALTDLAGFSIKYGEAEVKRIESNRRITDENCIVFLRGSRPPEEQRKYPEGHIDPWVRVFRLRREEKKDIVWSNYCGHPTASGGDSAPFVSGDFPGQALRLLEGEYPGDEYIHMMGPHGNLNPGKYVTGECKSTEDRDRDKNRMGKILANAVTSALRGAVELRSGSVEFERKKLLFPFRDGLPGYEQAATEYRDAVDGMKAIHAAGKKLVAGGDVRFTHRILYYHSILENGKVPVYLSGLKIGDLRVCFYPGEIFVEANDILRGQFPEKTMFTVSLCDGLFGYIITEDCYEPGHGGYEYTATLLGKGSFTECVNQSIQMFEDFK